MSPTIDQPTDITDFLRHSDDDTPIPTWKQITRGGESGAPDFISSVSRIVSATQDEQVAMETWNAWPGQCQRSVALLIDKIHHEGWLDSVGPIIRSPW